MTGVSLCPALPEQLLLAQGQKPPGVGRRLPHGHVDVDARADPGEQIERGAEIGVLGEDRAAGEVDDLEAPRRARGRLGRRLWLPLARHEERLGHRAA